MGTDGLGGRRKVADSDDDDDADEDFDEDD